MADSKENWYEILGVKELTWIFEVLEKLIRVSPINIEDFLFIFR